MKKLECAICKQSATEEEASINWGDPGVYVVAHSGDCQRTLDRSESESPCVEHMHLRKAKGIYEALARLDS